MSRSNLPYSIRKYIRREKARIRREISDSGEAERIIKELVERLFKMYNKEGQK
jgi:hypothetical protein